jgi:hypothetical protein
MARNSIGRAIWVTPLAVACVVFGTAQVQAMCGHNLSLDRSPYAILAPVTVSPTLGGEGRAAYDGSSRCPPDTHRIATDVGMRCKPIR